jgi:hypothetical protein
MEADSLMYVQMDVWRRLEGSSVRRYRCFRVLPEESFCVQSADTFSLPIDASQLSYLDRQYYELLIEASPTERGGRHPTIEQAIQAHDLEFGNRD